MDKIICAVYLYSILIYQTQFGTWKQDNFYTGLIVIHNIMQPLAMGIFIITLY